MDSTGKVRIMSMIIVSIRLIQPIRRKRQLINQYIGRGDGAVVYSVRPASGRLVVRIPAATYLCR